MLRYAHLPRRSILIAVDEVDRFAGNLIAIKADGLRSAHAKVPEEIEHVVRAERGALAEAQETFSRFDAFFRTIPSSRKDIPASKVSLFYLRDAEPNAEFESILKAFKAHKASFVV